MNKVARVDEYDRPENMEERPVPDQQDGGMPIRMEEYTQLRAQMAVAVRRCCPSWLTHYQDDIVQMATMAILRQKKKREGDVRFSPSYIRRVAYTAVIDEIRRQHGGEDDVPLETPEGELPLVDGSANPEDRAFAHEIEEGIRGCLKKLVASRRLAVTFDLLGYTVPEIAGKMGWTRKQAENLGYRGKLDLRECLRTKGLKP